MLKGLGDLGNMMKFAREAKKIQKQIKKIQTTAASNDGAVSATVNGEFEVLNLEIKEEAINPSFKKQLEKAVVSAINNAVQKNKQMAAEEMKKMTGGMNIPGMDGMF